LTSLFSFFYGAFAHGPLRTSTPCGRPVYSFSSSTNRRKQPITPGEIRHPFTNYQR
ncbi:hypothetical protein J6590_024327, partial [Homalodisca vitripennis]